MINVPTSRILRFDPVSFNGMATDNKKVQGDGSVVGMPDGILRCTANAINAAAYGFSNFFVPSGARLIVTCLARQVDSVASGGRIGIDQHPAPDKTGGNNVDFIEMDSTEWKPYQISVLGNDKTPFVGVTFGLWRATIGVCEFRDIKVVIENVNSPSPDVRAAMLKIRNGVLSIDQGMGNDPAGGTLNEARFTTMGIHTFKWIGTDGTLEVQWDPFQTWYRPIVVTTVDMYDGFTGYQCNVGYADRFKVRMQISRPNGTTNLSKATLTDDDTKGKSLFINLIAMSV